MNDDVKVFTDKFNHYRTLIDLSRQLVLVLPLLNRFDRAEVEERFHIEDVLWLKKWLKTYRKRAME